MANQVADEIKIQQIVNQLKIVLRVVLVLGVIGGTYLFIQRGATRKQESAFSSLYQAEKIEEDAMRAESEASKGKDPKVSAKLPRESFYEIAKTWSEDQRKEYVSKLEETVTKFPSTLPQALASLRLANLSYHLGKMDEAAKHFDAVLTGFKASNEEGIIFTGLAFEGKGALLETQKKWDDAYKTYESASQLAHNPLKPLALMGMARVLRAQGKLDQAKTFFDKVISEFPNSDYEKRARVLKDLPPQG